MRNFNSGVGIDCAESHFDANHQDFVRDGGYV